jgi:hypothetical protein
MSKRSDAREAREAAKAQRVIARNQTIINDERKRTAKAHVDMVSAQNQQRTAKLSKAVADKQAKLAKAQQKKMPGSVQRGRQRELDEARKALNEETRHGNAAVNRVRSRWKLWL